MRMFSLKNEEVELDSVGLTRLAELKQKMAEIQDKKRRLEEHKAYCESEKQDLLRWEFVDFYTFSALVKYFFANKLITQSLLENAAEEKILQSQLDNFLTIEKMGFRV